ncbi:MAG: metallopeptidase TldD-related protein [Candidatus Nanopelagicales bacterium]
MSVDLSKPQEIVEVGVELLGPEGGFVVVEAETGSNLRWANSTLTTNGSDMSTRVSVVAFDPRGEQAASGSASGQVRERAELEALVARARQVAQAADVGEDYFPPVAETGVGDGWDVPVERVRAAALAPVSALLAEVLPNDQAVEHFGYAEQTASTVYLGTCAGLRARLATTSARFELSGKSHGRTRSAWAGRAGERLGELDLASTVGEISAGLAAQARRIAVVPGRHTAILSPSAASDLLVYLLWSASARDALDGRNAFRGTEGGTAIGRRYSELPVRLASDPHAAGLACPDRVVSIGADAFSSPFDTGLPIAATDWIADGKLTSLVSTRAVARRGSLPVTPAAENILLEVPGRGGSLEDLAARVGEGLVLTCLWYIREVDPQNLLLTGLTRDGVYVVRGGEIVGAAGNFRFNESPIEMLARLQDAGAPSRCLPREWADWFSRAKIPPLAITEFNFSTPSDAI